MGQNIDYTSQVLCSLGFGVDKGGGWTVGQLKVIKGIHLESTRSSKKLKKEKIDTNDFSITKLSSILNIKICIVLTSTIAYNRINLIALRTRSRIRKVQITIISKSIWFLENVFQLK